MKAPGGHDGLAPKVALINLADHRDEFYAVRADLAAEEIGKVTRALSGDVELVLSELVRSDEAARTAAARAKNAGAELLLLHTPIWAPPNLALNLARIADLPIGLLANPAPATSGLPGLLSCAAALEEAGIAHRRFYGDIAQKAFYRDISAFTSAASVKARLVGMRMGLFGGFGVGLYSAGYDPAQWMRIFGLETVHEDQLAIVRAAEAQSRESVAAFASWLTARLGRIAFDGESLTPVHLEKQLRSYLAVRELARRGRYDLLALKCQPELSNGYVLQCLNIALLNDAYDADGPKEPLPCSCEADADGALTMKILTMLSGKPSALLDVRGFIPEENILILANCGGMPTYFAGRGERADENLRHVHVLPHVFGRAGGGTTQFVAAPGPITLARLCRRAGRYWLAILAGETVAKDREVLHRTTYPWPHAFVRSGLDPRVFVQEFGSNHIHAAPGDWRRELRELALLYGLECKDYSGGEAAEWPHS